MTALQSQTATTAPTYTVTKLGGGPHKRVRKPRPINAADPALLAFIAGQSREDLKTAVSNALDVLTLVKPRSQALRCLMARYMLRDRLKTINALLMAYKRAFKQAQRECDEITQWQLSSPIGKLSHGARITGLALAALRGTPYRACEQTWKPETVKGEGLLVDLTALMRDALQTSKGDSQTYLRTQAWLRGDAPPTSGVDTPQAG
jgi:hypothetical protein